MDAQRLSRGRALLERIYDRILFDPYWPDVINWESRETICRLMKLMPRSPESEQMTIEERYGTIEIK